MKSPCRLPKKIAGKVNAAGMEERKILLSGHGCERSFLIGRRRAGRSWTTSSTLAAMMVVAGRISRGEAKSFPDPPLLDGFGIPVAIWA